MEGADVMVKMGLDCFESLTGSVLRMYYSVVFVILIVIFMMLMVIPWNGDDALTMMRRVWP